jgi:hypothetical protein
MFGTASILSVYSHPTAVSWGKPHLEVFAFDSQYQGQWRYRGTNDSWEPNTDTLEPLGGKAPSFSHSLAAITRGNDNVHLFRAGNNNQSLYYKSHNDSFIWSQVDPLWDSQGGIISTQPGAVSWGPSRFDIFALGAAPQYQLFQKYWTLTSGWSDWLVMASGGWQLLPPTAVSWAANRIDVFLVNNFMRLQHTFWDGNAWLPSNGYEDLNGTCTSRPAAVSRGFGLLDVFVRGGDAGLWRLSYDGGSQQWSEWTAVAPGTEIMSDPDAVTCKQDTVDVFAWAANSSLLWRRWDVSGGGNGTWEPTDGFRVLGDRLTGPPKAVCDGDDSMHVFAYLMDRSIGHLAWDGAQGSWSPETGFDTIGTLS